MDWLLQLKCLIIVLSEAFRETNSKDQSCWSGLVRSLANYKEDYNVSLLHYGGTVTVRIKILF